MNDRHPSGTSDVPAPDASYPSYDGYTQGTGHGYAGYDGYSTGTFDNLGTAYGEGDPLFGELPGAYDAAPNAGYDNGQSGQYDASQWGATGTYETGGYDTGAYATGSYDSSAYATGTYETGAHETGAYETGTYETGAYATGAAWDASGYPLADGIPAQPQPDAQAADSVATGQWDVTTWDTTGQWVNTGGQWDTSAQWDDGTTGQWDTTGYDQTTAFPEAHGQAQAQEGQAQEHAAYQQTYDQQGAYEEYETQAGTDTGQTQFWDNSAYTTLDDTAYEPRSHDEEPVYDPAPEAEPEPVAVAEAAPASPPRPSRSATAGAAARKDVGGRSSRRRPTSSRPKRSAILTVAVPSVCALGVTAVAAASVSGMGDDKDGTTSQAVGDPSSYKPSAANSKLDSQLVGLSAQADDFANRASRTQERIDLKERQDAEKKKKQAEAARKEALRPKFLLPVKQHGLSAMFGQAGVNWMSVHTGIDFPVGYGTPVMAATDGTVRTQWNSAYGNMAIVTAPDGTETWYCHLSSTRIRAGSVQAGDVIAYSGNSGNSTGPHLHFEVRPGGGSAVDPLPWLRGHGLDPT